MAQLTFNPATGAASPVAGYAARVNGSGESFATITGGNGTAGNPGGNQYAYLGGTTDNTHPYNEIDRGFILFDTSSLGAAAIISAATFSIYVTSKKDDFTQSVRLVLATIAANNTIAAADYQGTNGNTASQATADVAITGMSTNAYNTWTLSATGISNINKTGITKFGTRLVADCTGSDPGWVSSGQSYIIGQVGGGANPPQLVVTYSVPGFFYAIK